MLYDSCPENCVLLMHVVRAACVWGGGGAIVLPLAARFKCRIRYSPAAATTSGGLRLI